MQCKIRGMSCPSDPKSRAKLVIIFAATLLAGGAGGAALGWRLFPYAFGIVLGGLTGVGVTVTLDMAAYKAYSYFTSHNNTSDLENPLETLSKEDQPLLQEKAPNQDTYLGNLWDSVVSFFAPAPESEKEADLTATPHQQRSQI